MREQQIRRHWIPGRQTLIRNDSSAPERTPDAGSAESAQETPADTTFDRHYGWFDLRREKQRETD